MKKFNSKKRRAALVFTFIELLFVNPIIAILVAMILPATPMKPGHPMIQPMGSRL